MSRFKAQIYSPRWGHPDPYTFTKTKDGWEVNSGGHKVTCKPNGGSFQREQDNHVIDIMENDGIFPPSCLPTSLEYLWNELENGDVSEKDAQAAIEGLADWISLVAQNKPGGYWKPVF